MFTGFVLFIYLNGNGKISKKIFCDDEKKGKMVKRIQFGELFASLIFFCVYLFCARFKDNGWHISVITNIINPSPPSPPWIVILLNVYAICACNAIHCIFTFLWFLVGKVQLVLLFFISLPCRRAIVLYI